MGGAVGGGMEWRGLRRDMAFEESAAAFHLLKKGRKEKSHRYNVEQSTMPANRPWHNISGTWNILRSQLTDPGIPQDLLAVDGPCIV